VEIRRGGGSDISFLLILTDSYDTHIDFLVPKLREAGISFFRLNLDVASLLSTYITRVNEEWEIENKRTSIDPNDVLLTIVGTIGRTAVVEDDTKFALQRSVAVIKPILISSIYLSYLLQSPFLNDNLVLLRRVFLLYFPSLLKQIVL